MKTFTETRVSFFLALNFEVYTKEDKQPLLYTAHLSLEERWASKLTTTALALI